MNGSWETLVVALVRTTVVTSIAATAAMWLLWGLRIRAAKTHRIVWLLVIAQGWLLWPYTWRMPESWGMKGEPVHALAVPAQVPETTSVKPTVVEAIVLPETATPSTINVVELAIEWSLAVWCLGIVLLVATGAWRYARLFAHGRPGEEVTNYEWLAEWDEVRGQKRSKRRSKRRTNHWAELRTTHNTGPLVCWVPWVLLVLVPRPLWANLARGERLAILRHELAHCERGDLWKNLAVRLLALPQWFNPLVWLAVRRFEEAGEWACDELVACTSDGEATSNNATEYARVLLHVADYSTHVPSGAAGLAGGELSRRIRRLLHLPNKEVREMRGFILPVLLVMVGLFQAVRIERVEADESATVPQVSPTAPEQTTGNDAEWWRGPLPEYVIEPPDILLIDIIKIVHKEPRKIQPYDQLIYRYTGPNPKDSNFDVDESTFVSAITVSPRGDLAFGKGCRFDATGFATEEAEDVLRAMLKRELPDSNPEFSLEFAPGAPQVEGEHLVGPDGKINFGFRYGSLYLSGMSLEEAKKAVEEHLSHFLVDPQVTVDVMAHNSKKYYVIEKGGEAGDNITMFPITGNDTVLDAIAALGGLGKLKSPKIWIDRPAPTGKGKNKILPVDYDAISRDAITTTNYQLWPGDRLFIEYPNAAKPLPPEKAYEPPTAVQADEIPNYHEYVRPALEAQARADAQPQRYYIITKNLTTKNGGHGDNIVTAPITGNDTVLDAISAIDGLKGEAKLWVERDDGPYSREVLDVRWHDITQGKDTSTNHQLLPGDRLFIEYPLVGVGVNSDAGVKGKIKLEEQKSAPPEVLQATHLRALPTEEGDQRVTKAKVRLVTDPKQNLRNIEGLEKGISITGETQLLEGLLGVLAKNDLTRELASPTITAVNGQVAKFHVVSDETDPPRVVDVELLNRHSGNQVVFETRACVQLGKRKRTLDTAFALTEGQSFLVRIPRDEKVPKSEDIYLLVSRESVE